MPSYHIHSGGTAGLDALLSENISASRYFSSLPQYVRDAIYQRAGSIGTETELKAYARKLLQND